MPSSLIFAGLVVLWLLILVPAVARRQQEVARLSPAVLSGRVLERPMRHRIPEVDMTERREDGGATTVGELARQRDDVPSPRERDEVQDRPVDERYADWWGPEAGRDAGPATDDSGTDRDDDPDDLRDDLRDELDRELDPDEIDRDLDDEHRAELDEDDADDDVAEDHEVAQEDAWQAPVARYRPGRGGFDPEAAAAAAHAKYAFRQRLVLALLVLLLGASACALLVSDVFWWVAGGLGLVLAGYLTYLRRQVRIEESIRTRRTERLAGTRRSAAADDPELDEWARRGAGAAHADEDDDIDEREPGDEPATDTAVEDDETDEDEDWTADDGQTGRVRGTGEPLGVLPARCRTVDGPENTEHASSLPRIKAAAPPPIPSGTALVDVDDEEELDAALGTGDHRRAVGE